MNINSDWQKRFDMAKSENFDEFTNEMREEINRVFSPSEDSKILLTDLKNRQPEVYTYIDWILNVLLHSAARSEGLLAALNEAQRQINELIDVVYGSSGQATGFRQLPRLFVSYSREDIDFRQRLTQKLIQVFGSNVWSDELIRGGQNWWNEILHQIAQSDIFVYLLSNEYNSSQYCKAEFIEANRLQKRIIPVKIRRSVDIPKGHQHFQIVDMVQGINVDTITDLFAAILYHSSQIPAVPPAPLSPHPMPLPPKE